MCSMRYMVYKCEEPCWFMLAQLHDSSRTVSRFKVQTVLSEKAFRARLETSSSSLMVSGRDSEVKSILIHAQLFVLMIVVERLAGSRNRRSSRRKLLEPGWKRLRVAHGLRKKPGDQRHIDSCSTVCFNQPHKSETMQG